MSEIFPVLIVGLVLLAIVVAVMAKMQLNKKAVVKPMDQEDLVERIKMRLTADLARALARQLAEASDTALQAHQPVVVDIYEPKTDRLLRFEVEA
jgi:hypothetical protein